MRVTPLVVPRIAVPSLQSSGIAPRSGVAGDHQETGKKPHFSLASMSLSTSSRCPLDRIPNPQTKYQTEWLGAVQTWQVSRQDEMEEIFVANVLVLKYDGGVEGNM